MPVEPVRTAEKLPVAWGTLLVGTIIGTVIGTLTPLAVLHWLHLVLEIHPR